MTLCLLILLLLRHALAGVELMACRFNGYPIIIHDDVLSCMHVQYVYEGEFLLFCLQ